MKKIRALAGVLLFVLALSAFPLVMLFTPDRSFSENENRYLSQKPQFSVSRLMSGEFMEDMEKYLDDQFPLRYFWTAAKSELLLLSGSREINGVYWGLRDISSSAGLRRTLTRPFCGKTLPPSRPLVRAAPCRSALSPCPRRG